MVVVAVAIGFALVVATQAAVGVLLIRCFRDMENRARRDLVTGLRAIVEPPAEGQPSALAVYSDQFATLLAGRFLQTIRASMAGGASVEAKASEAQALGAVAGSNPWLALLAGLLPKRFRNQLLSSPQFTSQLSMFGQGAQAAPGGSGNHDNDTVRERLKKGV